MKKPVLRKLVTWKDEGRQGPCTVYAADARPPMHPEYDYPMFQLYPFGEPLPAGIEDKGWMTRTQAPQTRATIRCRFLGRLR